MPVRGLGVDEGTATVKAVQVEKRGAEFVPVAAASIPGRVDGDASGAELAAAMQAAGIKERAGVVGLTGKDLVIRYHQVPAVPDWQLRQIMEFEVKEIESQSGDKLASDFNLLPVASDLSSDDTVLMALSREDRINERTGNLKSGGIKARYFVPNSLGLFHAFRLWGPAASGDVVLVNLGKACSDLTILRDGELLYARSVNTGGDVLTEAVRQHFNVSEAKAEKLKCEMGDLRPREQRRGLTPQQEKVSFALEGASGRLFQMVQSTVQFAKTQIQLNQLDPEKIFVTGGSANMPGLADSLSASLGVPVEVFDPVAEAGVEVVGDAGTVDMTVAAGLAALGADPDAYSVEVLDAAARKAKEFQDRQLWSVLAVVAILAYLGLFWVRSGDEFVKADKNYTMLKAEKNGRSSKESRLKSLSEERDDLSRYLDELDKRHAAGEALLRSLSLMTQHLPEDLWLEKIEIEPREAKKADSLTRVRLPYIMVHGRGKSIGDRSVDQSYSTFVDAVRADPDLDGYSFVDTPPTDRENFQFALEFMFLSQPPAVDDGEDSDEGSP